MREENILSIAGFPVRNRCGGGFKGCLPWMRVVRYLNTAMSLTSAFSLFKYIIL